MGTNAKKAGPVYHKDKSVSTITLSHPLLKEGIRTEQRISQDLHDKVNVERVHDGRRVLGHAGLLLFTSHGGF